MALFREYDIRGIAERDFDAEFARDLGLAFGTLVRERGGRRRDRYRPARFPHLLAQDPRKALRRRLYRYCFRKRNRLACGERNLALQENP